MFDQHYTDLILDHLNYDTHATAKFVVDHAFLLTANTSAIVGDGEYINESNTRMVHYDNQAFTKVMMRLHNKRARAT